MPTLTRSKYNRTDPDIESKINVDNLKFWRKYEQDMNIRELSSKSIYQYKRDIMQWFSYLVDNQYNAKITDLDEDDIEEFIYWCKENGNNTERIKRRISAISGLYIYLRRKKICKENPCEFILRPKKGLPVVVQTFLTQEQYDDMKKKLKECGDLQLLTYAMFSIDTMARVNAVSSIRWEQVDFENNTVDDVLEKEGYIVTLYFNNETRQLLLDLKKQREDENIDSPYVFLTTFNKQASPQTLTEWCKKIGKMIGVETLHPHDFRHSGSQLMNIHGAPIELISGLLNHNSLDVTSKFYLRQDKKKIQEQKSMFKY